MSRTVKQELASALKELVRKVSEVSKRPWHSENEHSPFTTLPRVQSKNRGA